MLDGGRGLRSVTIEGVSTAQCSVVQTTGRAGVAPTIFLHGILDNVWRWIGREEAKQDGLDLPDQHSPFPLFDVEDRPARGFPSISEGKGLLGVFGDHGLPAVAFSYQDQKNPVADMSEATRKLYRVAEWTVRHYGVDRLNLVGHSRGGLVCRHALLEEYDAGKARWLRERVDRLISICTPFRGSSLARVAVPISTALDKIGVLTERLPTSNRRRLGFWGAFEALTRNIGQLRPDSAEVLGAATEHLSALPIDHFAIAGNLATYFCYEVPGLGQLRLPPHLDIPEFTDGEGDMAVAVPSALDIPDPSPERTQIFPVNHLTATFDPRVQQTVLEWTGGTC